MICYGDSKSVYKDIINQEEKRAVCGCSFQIV